MLPLIIYFLKNKSVQARASWVDYSPCTVHLEENLMQIISQTSNSNVTIDLNDKILINNDGNLVLPVGNYELQINFYDSNVHHINLLQVYKELVEKGPCTGSFSELTESELKGYIAHGTLHALHSIVLDKQIREGRKHQSELQTALEGCVMKASDLTGVPKIKKLSKKERYQRLRDFLYNNPDIFFADTDDNTVIDHDILPDSIHIYDASFFIYEDTKLKINKKGELVATDTNGETKKWKFLKVQETNAAKDIFK